MNKTASETTVCKLREEAPRLRLRKRVKSRHLPSHWCLYSCVCRCVHTYLAWCKPEGGVSCSVLHSVYLFAFRQGLLMNWNMLIWLDWPPFSLSSAGVAGTYHHTYIVVVCPSVYFVLFSLHILTLFFYRCWRANSGLHLLPQQVLCWLSHLSCHFNYESLTAGGPSLEGSLWALLENACSARLHTVLILDL